MTLSSIYRKDLGIELPALWAPHFQGFWLEGLVPDTVCCNAAINACAGSGAWDAALALLAEMPQGRTKRDTVRPPETGRIWAMHAAAS